MRVNVYRSNGGKFHDDDEVRTLRDLASVLKDRYELDSDAVPSHDAMSVTIMTGGSVNVLFEAYKDGNRTVCGCAAPSTVLTPSDRWAHDIIREHRLSDKSDSMEIEDAIAASVEEAYSDIDNYTGDFIKPMSLPCTITELDDIISDVEKQLEKMMSSTIVSIFSLVKKALRNKAETKSRTCIRSHSRVMPRRFKNENDESNPKSDKRAIDRLIRRIYNDPEIKRLTSRVLTDDGAWGPFQSLIKALKSIEGVLRVSYGDSVTRSGLQNGYRWSSFDGDKTYVMKDKIRDVHVETEYGNLDGEIACWGAGSIEDPLERYDMTLQLWKSEDIRN